MSYLDVLLRKVVQIAGVNMPERRLWNFASGATAVDNPATGATDITIDGGGGGITPTGTGVPHVVGGVLNAASSLIVNADVHASAAIAGSKLAASTTSLAGSMSAADKTKLDAIEVGVGLRPGAYDPTDYAAPGDDITDGVTPADSAFLAMFAAMGPAPNNVVSHGAVYIPPGTYYFENDLVINRALDIRGLAPGSYHGNVVLKFARYKGIRCLGRSSSPDNGDANYVSISNVEIQGAHYTGTGYEAPVHTTWQADQAFAVGDKIVPLISSADRPATSSTGYGGSSFEYYYECIKNGTSSAGAEPDWPLVQSLDYSIPWIAGAEHSYGSVVRPSLSMRPAMDMAFVVTTPTYFVTGATSGMTEPAGFATAGAGDTVVDGDLTWTAFSPIAEAEWVVDGTCVWACRTNAGIFADVRLTVDQVYIRGFLNAAVHIQGTGTQTPNTNANGMLLSGVRIWECGVGILTRGGDANAGVCISFDISLFGLDDKEIGVAERSFLGNKYFGGQMATVQGPGFLVTSSSNTGGFYGIYEEADCGRPQIYASSFMVSGGTWGSQPTDDSFYMGATIPSDWRGVGFRDIRGDVSASIRFGDSTLGTVAANDDAYETSMGYADGYFHRYRANTSIYAVDAVSGSKSDEGAGFVWFPRATIVGPAKTFVGSQSMKTSSNLRHGRRIVGDVFSNPTSATTGVSYESIVTTAGYDADPWVTLTGYQPGSWNRGTTSYGNPSSMVKPVTPNGYVYRATKAGTSAAGEPSWPTTIGVEARTYSSTYVQWLVVGDFIRPTTPNGHHYEVTAIAGSASASLTGIEPTWPTSNGDTVVEDVITYTCRADDTASWVLDGSVIWTCIGVEAVYSTPGMSAADRTKFDGIQVQGTTTAVAAMAIDWDLSSTFSKTLAAGANTFTFSNATDGQCIIVKVTGAASTLTWPTVKWSGGTPPTQTASGIDVYTFVKIGSDIFGSVVQAMA